MVKITAVVHPEVLDELEQYRRKALRHRQQDPKYVGNSFSRAEAAGALISYGLSVAASLSPKDEETIGLPEGTAPVIVGPRARRGR